MRTEVPTQARAGGLLQVTPWQGSFKHEPFWQPYWQVVSAGV